MGILDLVDLAGTEPGVHGKRGESEHIKKSLYYLRLLLEKLQNNEESQINYRDSKLTESLRTSLKANSKSVMIFTVSPVNDKGTEPTLK